MNTQTKQNKLSKSVRIDAELWHMLKAMSKDEERPVIWFIERALRQTYLEPAKAAAKNGTKQTAS